MSTLWTKSQSTKALIVPRVDISEDKSPGKRNLILKNGDKVEKQTEKTRYTFLDKIEAIAYGVQARFEENSSFSRRVTETTVGIARKLGIPETEIKQWAASQLDALSRDTEKLNVIKSRLQRLQGSFLQQTNNKRHSQRAIRS